MMQLSNMKLRTKLLLGFAVPGFVTLVLCVVIYASLANLSKASDWISHTHEAINYGETLMGSMIDMETGLRGYLIAGDDVFLDPYHSGIDAFRSSLAAASQHVSDNPAQIRRLDKIGLLKQAWLTNHFEPATQLRRDANSGVSTIDDIAAFIGRGLGKKSMDELRGIVSDFTQAEQDLIVQRTETANAIIRSTHIIAVVGAIIAVLGSIMIAVIFSRNVGRQLGTEPGTVKDIANAIAAGDLSSEFASDKPLTGVYAAMQIMQSNLLERDLEDKKAAAYTARIKQALDSASSAVLVVDAAFDVIYQNSAGEQMFRALGPELRKVLPEFDPATIIGTSFEQLIAGGASISELRQLNTNFKQDCQYADVSLRQVFSPIVDEQGVRMGTVIEWQDRSKRIAVENEIRALVDAALIGDLSHRLNLDDKDGFFLMLGEGMNSLVKVCDDVINDVVRVFSALSRLDLTESVNGDYSGSFAALKDNANQTVTQLTQIIHKVKNDAARLDSETQQLNELNRKLLGAAEKSSDQAITMSAAAEQINANIGSVAGASTQMSASISEISRNASDATRIAGEAVELADSTETTVRQLSTSSTDIGNVIKVINSIAEQTNLLALNATIEAARAGDAGKGFAVVANEVKDLAKETAKATDEISTKIAAIQDDSNRAVAAIGGIDKTIQEINSIQVMISSAVAEQTATTNEISRSVNEVANGSTEVAENSSNAVGIARNTVESVSDAQESTRELAELASELRQMVDQFEVLDRSA